MSVEALAVRLFVSYGHEHFGKAEQQPPNTNGTLGREARRAHQSIVSGLHSTIASLSVARAMPPNAQADT